MTIDINSFHFYYCMHCLTKIFHKPMQFEECECQKRKERKRVEDFPNLFEFHKAFTIEMAHRRNPLYSHFPPLQNDIEATPGPVVVEIYKDGVLMDDAETAKYIEYWDRENQKIQMNVSPQSHEGHEDERD